MVEFLTPKSCNLDMDPKIALGLVEKFDRPFDKTSIDLNLSADEIIQIPRELAKLDTENVNGHYKRQGCAVKVSPKLDSTFHSLLLKEVKRGM